LDGCPSLLTWPSDGTPPMALQHSSADLLQRVTGLGFYNRAVAGRKRERSEPGSKKEEKERSCNGSICLRLCRSELRPS